MRMKGGEGKQIKVPKSWEKTTGTSPSELVRHNQEARGRGGTKERQRRKAPEFAEVVAVTSSFGGTLQRLKTAASAQQPNRRRRP